MRAKRTSGGSWDGRDRFGAGLSATNQGRRDERRPFCRPSTLQCQVPCFISYRQAMSDLIDAQLKKGVLELCVLELLSHGESYAYEIASRLADAIGMGEGTVYPLMRRLHTDGLVETHLVESTSGPPRKYYRITRA